MLRSAFKASRLARWPSSSAYRLLSLEGDLGLGLLLSRKQTLSLLLVTGTTVSAYAIYRLQPSQRLYCDIAVTATSGSRGQDRFGLKKGSEAVEESLTGRSESYLPSSSAGFKRFDFAQAGR
jgi:hypothetical protein